MPSAFANPIALLRNEDDAACTGGSSDGKGGRLMRSRRWAAVGFLVAVGIGYGGSASAQESLVQFTTNSNGGRTVTVATPPSFALTDLNATNGDVATTAPAATSLTETFATGASWSVKAQMCGPNSYATPTAADCGAKPNQMVRADGGAAADRLEGSTIDLNRGTIVNGGLPLHTVTAGSETNLGSQVTLMQSSDELATTLYSGVYSVTTGLTVQDLIRTGTWKGYWVITQTT
jgi:hypothetical protein